MSNSEFLQVVRDRIKVLEREDLKKRLKVIKGGRYNAKGD